MKNWKKREAKDELKFSNLIKLEQELKEKLSELKSYFGFKTKKVTDKQHKAFSVPTKKLEDKQHIQTNFTM